MASKVRYYDSKVDSREAQSSLSQRPKKHRKLKEDPFPGSAPVSSESLDRHSRGPEGISIQRVKGKFAKKEWEEKEKISALAEEFSARSELLLEDDSAGLEGDDLFYSSQITQTQIRAAVDHETATKGFELSLEKLGPYKVDYTRNGRLLVLGGRRGHVAAFDWQSKDITCEINVMESVHDVKWLHFDQMFAVAQKKWTYIYDRQGVELHCLKTLHSVNKLEFLPYHFLLFAASSKGFLSWVDVSLGKMVAQFNGKNGPLEITCQNPWNAVVCCGHSKGTVTMWTPNVQEPVIKILCHHQAVTGVAVEKSGNYMATTGIDRALKIWDIRNTFEPVQIYRFANAVSKLDFSGKGLLATAKGNCVEIFKDPCREVATRPYMRHKAFKNVSDLKFVPYEDVLGIGHNEGFSSILIPGSGVANFDSLEVNPYQNKKQRREAEVKALLDKIQPELITLDPTRLGEIDVLSLEKKTEEDNQKLFVKPKNIDFESRVKGRLGSTKKFHIKRTLAEEERRKNIKRLIEKSSTDRVGRTKKEKKPKGLLDRLA